MAIVKMARARLAAFSSERDLLLRNLQELSEVHFADLRYNFVAEDYDDVLIPDEASADLAQVREQIALLETAIDGLTSLEAQPGFFAGLNSALPELSFPEAEEVAKAHQRELLELAGHIRQKLRDLAQTKEDEIRFQEQKRQIMPFQKLDVSLAEINRLKKVYYALGLIPRRAEDELRHALAGTKATYFQGLSQDEKSVFFLLIYMRGEAEQVETALQKAAFTSRNFRQDLTVAEILADYDRRIAEVRTERREIEAELKSLSQDKMPQLKLLVEWLRNEQVRLEAREQFIRGNHVFLLELYVPQELTETLRRTVDRSLKLPYNLEVEMVEREDPDVEEVPVLLRNNKLVQPFESIVSMFATPRYDEIDPTGVVMPWYSFCFAYMLGDAGYGLVLFLLSTLGLLLFKQKPSSRSTLRFFQILSIPSMLVGLIFGSFFAIDIPRVLPFIGLMSPTADTDAALVVSMLIGVVMLFFGLAVKGFMLIRDKDPLGLLADVFAWYGVVVGVGLLLFADRLGLGPAVKPVAKVMLIVGLVLVFLFSARDEKSWGGRLGWGVYNVYGATSWIGDIVSFSRLAALAMSGGFIGYSFNMIAGMLSTSAFGKVATALVLLISHPFNMFLSCLSAYVHTLRLIYVEFFGQFYEGGGKPFRRFRAESEYIEIK